MDRQTFPAFIDGTGVEAEGVPILAFGEQGVRFCLETSGHL